MRTSRYNLSYKHKEEEVLIFNAFTRKFFCVSSKHFDLFNDVITHPSSYEGNQKYKSLLDNLLKNGFILDDETEELSVLAKIYQENSNQDCYTLLIMPTYQCNFSCWYCIQKHESVFITDEVERRIIDHIESYLSESGVRQLHITWFGGEPLLGIERIESISEQAKFYCESNGIGFTSSITTNGALLTDRVLARLSPWNFTSFQITLDGKKEHHNNTRYNARVKDSFSLILNNIVALTRHMPEAQVILRINYDQTNLAEQLFYDVDTILGRVKSHITVILRRVWQIEETEEMREKAMTVMRLFVKSGYRVDHDFDDFNLISCYVEQKHYSSVFPNGFVDRCNNKDMYAARGYLDDCGTIRRHSKPKEQMVSVFSEDSECYSCKYLPICMGPCPHGREQATSSSDLRCIYIDRDKEFEADILTYCKLKQLEA